MVTAAVVHLDDVGGAARARFYVVGCGTEGQTLVRGRLTLLWFIFKGTVSEEVKQLHISFSL